MEMLMARLKKKFNTIGMDGVASNSQLERKQQRLAMGEDIEAEKLILDARLNRQAQEDAGMDALLDAVKKSSKKKKRKGA